MTLSHHRGHHKQPLKLPEKPSERFRAEHREIRQHLVHMDELAGQILSHASSEQKQDMKRLVDYLKKHIIPHAEWEEKILYGAVDKLACNAANPFTSTMRYDHKIVNKWIGELAEEAAKGEPDPAVFSRKMDHLMGLIFAHFEKEEEVLLPILDETMSREQFDQEIMGVTARPFEC